MVVIVRLLFYNDIIGLNIIKVDIYQELDLILINFNMIFCVRVKLIYSVYFMSYLFQGQIIDN